MSEKRSHNSGLITLSQSLVMKKKKKEKIDLIAFTCLLHVSDLHPKIILKVLIGSMSGYSKTSILSRCKF